ncbi:hypothetical protein HDU76_002977 [Blyttiomyces sp. JEL0837]|nr:hypothetical protein HDU76_002977 [Blyttiomyces sp. JEL0837]
MIRIINIPKNNLRHHHRLPLLHHRSRHIHNTPITTSTPASAIKDHVDIVICGGGLIGASVAFHILRNATSSKKPLKIVIVDKDEPMRLTSTASTAEDYAVKAGAASLNGSGDLRFHTSAQYFNEKSYASHKDGFDLIDVPEVIRKLIPGVSDTVKNMMHVRKAGYLHVERLGEYLLQQSIQKNTRIIRGSVENLEWSSDANGKRQVSGVVVSDPVTGESSVIKTNAAVISVGPYLKEVCKKIGFHVPVFNELHARVEFTVSIADPLNIIPEHGPFAIWSDDIELPFSKEEVVKIRAAQEKDPSKGYDSLLRTFKIPGIAGCHARPFTPSEANGVRQFFGIWTYDNDDVYDSPKYPSPLPELYPTVILRGLSRLYPQIKSYFPSPTSSDPLSFLSSSPSSPITAKSGYYCKTATNTPLIGTVDAFFDQEGKSDGVKRDGLFMCAGVSGFGVMCSQSAGELAATKVLGYLNEGKMGMGVVHGKDAEEFEPMRWISGARGRDFGDLKYANQL